MCAKCVMWNIIYMASMHLFVECGLWPCFESILHFLHVCFTRIHVINFWFEEKHKFLFFIISTLCWVEFSVGPVQWFSVFWSLARQILHNHYHNSKYSYLFSVVYFIFYFFGSAFNVKASVTQYMAEKRKFYLKLNQKLHTKK